MSEEKACELNKLYKEIRADSHYRTSGMGSVFVPGTGPVTAAPIVLVGEAPGREEEKQQRPFVGQAGKNLNLLLQSIGLSPEQLFITNLLKYRPLTPKGGNRCPTAKESRNALPYLLRELTILAPRLVVCLGLSSAKALLEDGELKMGDANGRTFQRHGFKILVTYHPSPLNFLIPAKKEAMQKAFQQLKQNCS
jgi:DNA polymerase